MPRQCHVAPSEKASPRRSQAPEPAWAHLTDEQLKSLRFCDLGLTLRGTVVERHIDEIKRDLKRRGIRFQPHVWLSEEWFSPDGVPGIAVPFYLAHPRLMRLERRFMHEVEGGNDNWLMRILRHETGHAIDTAFGLRRRKAWRAGVRQGLAPLSRHLSAAAGEPQLRAAPGPLVRAEPPDRGLRRDIRGVAAAAARWRREYAGWPAMRSSSTSTR